jgi:L-fuculose-phosphate aldolase
MEPDDIVPVPLHVTGAWHKAASRELPMHLAIYRRRPDVRAVVHTHSVHATAWSFLDLLLEPETEEVSYYKIGAVRTSQWALSGSPELAQHAAEALGNSRAALLARHGVVAAASTVEDARIIAEAVEHQAHVAWLLRTSTAT